MYHPTHHTHSPSVGTCCDSCAQGSPCESNSFGAWSPTAQTPQGRRPKRRAVRGAAGLAFFAMLFGGMARGRR